MQTTFHADSPGGGLSAAWGPGARSGDSTFQLEHPVHGGALPVIGNPPIALWSSAGRLQLPQLFQDAHITAGTSSPSEAETLRSSRLLQLYTVYPDTPHIATGSAGAHPPTLHAAHPAPHVLITR